MGILRILIVGLLTYQTLALSSTRSWVPTNSKVFRGQIVSNIAKLRGGEEGAEEVVSVTDDSPPITETGSEQQPPPPQTVVTSSAAAAMPKLSILTTALATVGKKYSSQLERRPILTKSYTAGLIFGLSDYLAQRIEQSGGEDKKPLDRTRLLVSTAVGLFYFGPAAHYWYEMIFQLLPGTGLISTIQKAVLGQLLFGPSFTCIFFAASLLQSGTFSLSNWARKIRNDLPGAWLAGCGFWPLVDLISYSLVPINLIPLFINLCSLVWTIYLSLVANRQGSKAS